MEIKKLYKARVGYKNVNNNTITCSGTIYAVGETFSEAELKINKKLVKEAIYDNSESKEISSIDLVSYEVVVVL